ncbi:MAG: hypothetical protein PF692_02060 [Kiritimatiellae bacterium]|jgi:hypothetical protein|nr:hypothetical protein [Kiritimatiellia bacterium]
MIKCIYLFMFIFLSCAYCVADSITLLFLSHEKREKGREHLSLQAIDINETLRGASNITESTPTLYWEEDLSSGRMKEEDVYSYYPLDNLFFYYYTGSQTGGMKFFNLDKPSSPLSVPAREYFRCKGACFYLPQLNLVKYPKRFFVLFMNYNVDLVKAYKELSLNEYHEVLKNAHLLPPTLKSYQIGSFEESIETDLNMMTNMGERLSVYLSPSGEINYMGYGLASDKIKLPFTMPKDIISKLNITDLPKENMWVVLRNRRNYLVLTRRGKTLIYFKKFARWDLHQTPLKFKLTDSNKYLIFNFIGTYGKDQFGDDLEIYDRRKLCVNLKNGDSRFMDTEIDSRIIYFDGDMKIVLNETGFEVSKRDELLKFIYYPQAEYIDEVMFKVTR